MLQASLLIHTGFDEGSVHQMGTEWEQFVPIFRSCLQLVEDIEMEPSGWEDRQADERLVKAMEPWLSGKTGIDVDRAKELPDNFLGLWTNHLNNKMLYKLVHVNVQPATAWAEIQKKKFWCSGSEGLLMIALGLRWAWLKLQDPLRIGLLEAWAKLVTELTLLFRRVLDGSKKQ